MLISLRRLLTAGPCALVVTAGALLAAPVAQADVLGSLINFNSCNGNPMSQPFARWGDQSYYELAPGGTFSDNSWTLSGRASYVSGGEPWGVTGSVSARALSIPGGSSATSPTTCDTADYPTLRYFVGGWGLVAVSVVDGGLPIPAGVATAGGSWAPSPSAITLSAVTGLLSGGTTDVAIRFTTILGDVKISDVFIDPCRRS